MKLASRIAVVALLAAIPASAQLHRCQDKSGKTTYQDQPCEGAAGSAKAAGATGAEALSYDDKSLGLWEDTLVNRPRLTAAERTMYEATGAHAYELGRPLKMVTCTENPSRLRVLATDCEKQMAARGGTCRKVEDRSSGPSRSESVTVITGNYRTQYHIEQTITSYNELGPATRMVYESSSDHRYLGPCKPGMVRHSSFYVNEKGDWITEAQFREDQEREARAAFKRSKDR